MILQNLHSRGAPRRQLPLDAREALQLQRLALPSTTWSPGTVQGAQAGIDRAGVGFGAESVAVRGGLGLFGSAVLADVVSDRTRVDGFS
jgi:hypothetical protein